MTWPSAVVLRACILGAILASFAVSHPGIPRLLQTLTPICVIQGGGISSPYAGRSVQTQGIVTADFDQISPRGFYLQAPGCDFNPSTSDGIFVYLGERLDVVQPGDLVQVSGQVQEYYGMTEIVALAADVSVVSANHPIPDAVELAPPSENAAARLYFESLEAMRVQLSDGRVVGPTGTDDRSWLVRADLGLERVFFDDPAGTGARICVDDGGLFEIQPEVKVGDRVVGLTGVLDFRIGLFCLQLTQAPEVHPKLNQPCASTEIRSLPSIRLATFNLAELFDTEDDPLTADQVLSNFEYQRRLGKRALVIGSELRHPALLAVQEAETSGVLQDLTERPEILARYEILHQDGPDGRGLDAALLYRPDLVTVWSSQVLQECTGLIDGLGPDGNGDVKNPQNNLTCDRDGDGLLDGNRLFSRPPLVVKLWARFEGNEYFAAPGQPKGAELWVIACHFKSKVEDTSSVEYTLPRRLREAQVVAEKVSEIRQVDPGANVVVLGDLNDHLNSLPIQTLINAGLKSSLALAARPQRYTYIYQGISQVLDEILFTPRLDLIPGAINPLPINADYPAAYAIVAGTSRRSSDHDPVVLELVAASPEAYLPLISR